MTNKMVFAGERNRRPKKIRGSKPRLPQARSRGPSHLGSRDSEPGFALGV
ncbi:MAG: hypothetical protein LBT86_05005 [Deltaproteobacteria bacterium]|nr:hypothetical protein [Deltaproteobacteria bacterium]